METKKPEHNFNPYIEEKCIKNLQVLHCGRANAIKRIDLSMLLNIPEGRKTRSLIRHLIVVHDCPIGSDSSKGYYWINSTLELKMADEELEGRIEKLQTRRKYVKLNFYKSVKNRPRLFEVEV